MDAAFGKKLSHGTGFENPLLIAVSYHVGKLMDLQKRVRYGVTGYSPRAEENIAPFHLRL